MSSSAYRLPRHVLPQHYRIELEATPRQPGFSGRVTIVASVDTPESFIELHARHLTLSDLKVSQPQSGIRPSRLVLVPEKEMARIELETVLEPGPIEVSISFLGNFNPGMHGLYLAEDGPERALVSQCEATNARGIFPCFDEPSFKATLAWTITTDADLTVIANGVPQTISKLESDASKAVHVFAPTRVISTYLAAVTIGPFETTAADSVSSTPCRIVCGESKLGLTDFARGVTSFVLPWYEDYFQHPYNYQKLDQVAVPGFDAGAMENVGAIFYRQSLLLVDENSASWGAKKRIAEVIAHEIAHQWFGNLVTMAWWDDLWLNEAFATWVAFKACDQWQPGWRMWDDYLVGKESALHADALLNTHPVYTDVASPAEATELFDVITYEKGCAILRMVESFLGEDTFRTGLRSYIARHKNANARGHELWGCLEESSEHPVGQLMTSWINQSGFPLVEVALESKGQSSVVHLKQQRFFANSERMAQECNTRWMLPMVLAVGTDAGIEHHRVLVENKQESIELTTPSEPRWVYANPEGTGFYRLQLDETLLQALLAHGLSQLSPSSRVGLLEDQWALVRNGRSDIARHLQVMSAFRDDSDYVVVRALAAQLRALEQRWVDDSDQSGLAAFVRWLLEPQYTALGWTPAPGESPAESERRAAILETLGFAGQDANIIANAEKRWPSEVHSPSDMEPHLADAVVFLTARGGDEQRLRAFVDEYLKRKKAGAPPQLQSRYLSALGAFQNPTQVEHVLSLTIDGTLPQEQLRTVLGSMLGRRHSSRVTWNFLKQHWVDLAPKVGAMGIARLVEATGAIPVDLRDDVARFFMDHPVKEAKRALRKALEALDLRREFLAREAPRLKAWLAEAPYLKGS